MGNGAVEAPAGVATRIERMDPKALKLLEVNARFMRHEQFQRLVENVRRDGALTSVPFACRDDDGRYLVLSGNHRVMAAVEAGLAEIDVMLTDDPLSQQQRIAIQLSHNAIVGEDDPDTLKHLYDQLEDLDLRIYSGLDDKRLGLLPDVSVAGLSEVFLDFATVSLVFLPEELKDVAARFAEIRKQVAADEYWLVRWSEYERYLDAAERVGQAFKVKNMGLVLGILVRLAERHLDDLREGFLDPEGEPLHKGWVPVAALLGRLDMPPGAAAVVERAIKKMVDRGDAKADARWQALERWAADYLAGV